jgi:hypothetical protein
MTSAVDERGAEASPKFRVLLTASLVSDACGGSREDAV